jgi:hypothetical protein
MYANLSVKTFINYYCIVVDILRREFLLGVFWGAQLVYHCKPRGLLSHIRLLETSLVPDELAAAIVESLVYAAAKRRHRPRKRGHALSQLLRRQPRNAKEGMGWRIAFFGNIISCLPRHDSLTHRSALDQNESRQWSRSEC